MQVYIQARITFSKTKLFLLATVHFRVLLRDLVTLRLPSLPFIKINVAIYNLLE